MADADGRPVLVGEANPYGADPRFALYPLPEHAAGGRLAKILGLSRGEYLRVFRRVNLCPHKWSTRAARERAKVLAESGAPLVLLGRKVALVFGLADQPPFTQVGRIYLIPHPSGLNRAWNDPGAVVRARALVAPLLCAQLPPHGYDPPSDA